MSQLFNQLVGYRHRKVRSTFGDKHGHGDCGKKYSSVVGCYVTEPTSCKDIVNFPNGNYSIAEACNRRLGEDIL